MYYCVNTRFRYPTITFTSPLAYSCLYKEMFFPCETHGDLHKNQLCGAINIKLYSSNACAKTFSQDIMFRKVTCYSRDKDGKFCIILETAQMYFTLWIPSISIFPPQFLLNCP